MSVSSSITIDSPLGPIVLESDGSALTGLTISPTPLPVQNETSDPVLQAASQQLGEYFAGTRQEFSIPLSPRGTPFQEKVWAALQSIPFGTTTSYQKLGENAGVGTAPRAVGGAVGANPLPIVIPCHRVLSANSTLTGYSGGAGIPTKVLLLDLEGISYR